ncbi:NAD(P)H-hydrate dehydratase [Microbacterium betulae]|uniref:ADP-dependent (S)-NAD(P)H-hydrate dehydratase n=1 Tax=Microbacterium betulae TaxID=2981139 RepID=A0AA97I626_9MICO|nr:ADP/ATP-dependent (S)-NAD(P)H-hydrate dehydratase [Microbacterium sp. AB]WOF22172.1 NAD(P)H-hydrate dehydratase [Microbacterium sp. AB]
MPGGHASRSEEWTARDAAGVLRTPTARDHKYSRGVVVLRTGSSAYPGAAVLSAEGAWRAGVGMVRWDGPSEVAGLVLQRRPETVIGPGRADAWVVGSGVDARTRGEAETRRLRSFLREGAHPTVLDAGALDLAAEAAGPIVVTPHEDELREVRIPLGFGIDDVEDDPLAPRLHGPFRERLLVVRETAVALGGVVLLKGSSTIVATPGGWWTAVRAGTPWLSTAGTGDVLAGAMGAVLAGAAAGARVAGRRLDAEELGPIAATAAWLHGTAGRIAAGQATEDVAGTDIRGADRAAGPRGAVADAPAAASGRPITALDVAAALPAAFAAAFSA